MKHIKQLPIFFILMAMSCLIMTGCLEHHMTVTIKPDGTCIRETSTTIPRNQIEQQVSWMKSEENGDEDTEKTETDSKASKDDELKRQIKKMTEQIYSRSEYGKRKITTDKIEVDQDNVRIKMTFKYPSVRDFVMQPRLLYDLGYERMLIEDTEDGKIRFTLSRKRSQSKRYKKYFEQLAVFGFKGSFKLIMPGKIISSSLSESDDNSTWVSLDTSDKKNVEAVLSKVSGKSLVIISEKGGLRAELPLDSKKLIRQANKEQSIGHSMPVTEATPGYLAEARSVTTVQVKYFPEGRKQAEEDEDSYYSEEQEGTVIYARLYTPGERHFLSLEKIENIKAVDDKGRAVPGPANDRSPAVIRFRRNHSEKNMHADFEIHLSLPKSDAEAIEQITGEATAVTHGKWKEYSIDKIQEDPGKEYDLASILPGTTMTIRKISQKSDNQGSTMLQLKGPDQIRYLEFKVEKPGTTKVSTYPDRGKITEKDGQTIRDISIGYYWYDMESKKLSSPGPLEISLIVLFPDDLKRELIKFSLEPVDLY